MSTEPDPKIIDLIQASAKDALPGGDSGFQSLEFFPPRTDTVRYVGLSLSPVLVHDQPADDD